MGDEGSAELTMQNASNFTYCSCAYQCRTGELSHTNISCDCVWSIPPPRIKHAPYVAAVEACFFLVAFFWNFFIIISFAMRRRLLKEPASIYLLNLAVTDFLLAIFVIFQCFIAELADGFIIGHTDVLRCRICEFLGFMIMLLMASTLHTLAVLSFDRFFLLANPMSYKKYFNWRRALVIVILLWCLSFCIAIPPIFGFGEYAFSVAIANCHPQWTGFSYTGIKNIHYIIFVGVEALIPIAFLTFTNMWTYKIVTGVLRARLDRHYSFRDKSIPRTQQIRNEHAEHTKQQLQLMKVFGGLFLAHIACWMPVLTVLMVANIVGPTNIPIEVYITGWLFYLTNPVAHPILETFFIKDLRTKVNQAKTSVKTSLKNVGSFSSNVVKRSLTSMRHKDREESGCSPSKCNTSTWTFPTTLCKEGGQNHMTRITSVKFTVNECQEARDGQRINQNGYTVRSYLEDHATHQNGQVSSPESRMNLRC